MVVFCQSIEELETRCEINVRSTVESRAFEDLPEKANTAGKSNLYYFCQTQMEQQLGFLVLTIP